MHFLYGIFSYVLFGRPFSFSFPAASPVCGTILSSLLVYARASQWFLPYFIWRQEPAVRPPFSTRSPCAIHSGLGQRRSTALPSVWSGHQWGAARLPPVQDENKQEGSRKHWMPKCMRMHEKAKQKMIENDKARRNPNLPYCVFFPYCGWARRHKKLCKSVRLEAAQSSPFGASGRSLFPTATARLALLKRLTAISSGRREPGAPGVPGAPGGGSYETRGGLWEYHLQDTQCSLTMTHSRSPSLAITFIYIYTYVVQYYKTDRQRRRDCSGQLPDVPIRIY